MTRLTRPVLEREICGAIRSTIEAHGPITREWAPSAAERIIAALKARGIFKDDPELQEVLRGIAPTPITDEDCRIVYDALSPEADSKAARRLYRFVTIARSVADLAWPEEDPQADPTHQTYPIVVEVAPEQCRGMTSNALEHFAAMHHRAAIEELEKRGLRPPSTDDDVRNAWADGFGGFNA